MADRTCSIEGCTGKHRSRGWCLKHYSRWRKTGDPLGIWRPVAEECSSVGCKQDGPYRRGLCGKHYAHWRRAEGLAACTIDGCDRPAISRGWCEAHYVYWRRTGQPGSTGHEVGYAGLHYRVRTSRGNAAGYPCQHCGKPAAHWAYDHEDSAERRGPSGLVYSMDPEHYIPLCYSCHMTFDKKRDVHGPLEQR